MQIVVISLTRESVRFMSPVGFRRQQIGGKQRCQKLLAWTCTQDTNNFAPNEYREVVNLSGLAVYKGSNAKGNSDNATKGKVKQ